MTEIALKSELQQSLDIIDKKIAEIVKIKDTKFKTSCRFKFGPLLPNDYNITTLQDISSLLGMLGYVGTKNKEYTNAAKIVGLDSYPLFNWLGYTYEEWEHDFILRIGILTQTEKLKALKDAKAQLNQFLSKDDKLAQTLINIKELIK